MKMSIHKLFQPIPRAGFMKLFLASIPLLAGILLALMNSDTPWAGDFLLIAWKPGQELLATGSVHSNYPYPLWTVVVMVPFAALPVRAAVDLWFLLNVLMLAASLALILLQTGLEISPFLFGVAVLFSGFLLPIISSIWLGQLSIFSLFILVLTTCFFLHQRWIWLGIVLGLSFIKPQVMIMLTGLILLWALLHRRWQTLLGFGGVIALLILISLPFISSPGQIIGGGIASHLGTYIGETSTIWALFLALGIPLFVPLVISIALIVWLGIAWRPFLRAKTVEFDQVLFLFSAAILVNLITIPYSWMHNLALMLLPIGYCVAHALKWQGKAQYYWPALLSLIMYPPLMLGLFMAHSGPTRQAYQIIPAMILLTTLYFLEAQKNRSRGLSGQNIP